MNNGQKRLSTTTQQFLVLSKNDEYKFFQNAAHDIPRRGRTGCL